MNLKSIAGIAAMFWVAGVRANDADGIKNDSEPPAPVSREPLMNTLTLGVRGGVPLKGSDYFGDIFTEWTPDGWGFVLSEDFSLRFGVTGGVGVLGDGSHTAVLFHVGPYIEVVHAPSGLRILGRSEPLVMSRHTFGFQNLGSDFEFVSSMGLYWRHEDSGWTLGVAYQHISNAGLSDANPGTDHIIFSLSHRF